MLPIIAIIAIILIILFIIWFSGKKKKDDTLKAQG